MSELSLWKDRARFAEEECKRLHVLLANLTKPQPLPKHGKPRQLPDPELAALAQVHAPVEKQAEKIFLEKATKALVEKGYSRVDALKEAKRLRREITDMQPESE